MNENSLQIFTNPMFGEIRTIKEDGQVLFCGVDIARALGYVKPHGAISKHCRHSLKRGVGLQKGNKADGSPIMQTVEMVFIPSGDVYRMAARSQLEGAEKFESWIFDEVVPTVMETGSCALQQHMTPAQLIAAQAQVLVEIEGRQAQLEAAQTALAAKVDNAVKVFSRPTEDHWKSDMERTVKALCADIGWSRPKLQGRLYAELEQKANCDVDARLRNLRSRKMKTGARYRDAHALTKLDAIAADKQLRAIFEGIVREWQAGKEAEK